MSENTINENGRRNGMGYKVDCTGWSKERLWESFLRFSQRENAKIVLCLEENKIENSWEKLVGKYLIKLGIPPHLNGYTYLKYSVARCLCHPEELESMTKILYPVTAKKFGTTSGGAEHGIRHAIQTTFEKGRTAEWEYIFGKNSACCSKKPTNAQFIATLSDFINLNPQRI